MRTEQKTNVKNSVGRLMFVLLSFFAQTGWIIVLFLKLNAYSTWISVGTSIIAFCVSVTLYSRDMNSGIRTPWIMLILVFPIMGLCVYIMFGRSEATQLRRAKSEMIHKDLEGILKQDPAVMEELEREDYALANQSRYLSSYCEFPVYRGTDVVYFADAAEGFEAQLRELKKAQKFIFMEYHAIEDAQSFGKIKQILVEKVKEGVEVRLFYDDVGSIGFINPEFIKQMRVKGIQCRVFNKLIPMLRIFMNNRDHRKITVIDGKVGFTGGYNLADEYFNITHPYGEWKDSGVQLTGEAVKSLTVMFLEMWNFIEYTDRDFGVYMPEIGMDCTEPGFIQPYADDPLLGERVGENVYLNLIKNAKHYIYFATPYLIITDEMKRELTLAAKRGVDVRIVTPGIPDKKIIYQVTRSYYAGLVKHGVRIFEYTPGFCHEKQCICDDESGTIGTINLDYRSLYHHYENGVLFHKASILPQIRKDFEEMFGKSKEVTEEYRFGKSAALRFEQCLLRLVSPLL